MPHPRAKAEIRAELATRRAPHLPGNWPMFTTHELMGRGGLVVWFRGPTQLEGRKQYDEDGGWMLSKVGFVTDTAAHWKDYPAKRFPAEDRTDLKVRDEAIRYATELYGWDDWTTSPLGWKEWVPRGQLLARYEQMGIDPWQRGRTA